MIRPIHPFPARMAPELAISELCKLDRKSVVLDPMTGSGTVVRHACELGYRAVGIDSDPLSVLMSKVWTTPVRESTLFRVAFEVMHHAQELATNAAELPWIDNDDETKVFVNYWFGVRQRNRMRRLAHALWHRRSRDSNAQMRAASDVLRIALSRIVITKERGASLARDVSHSRPHRTQNFSDFDVFAGFERAVAFLANALTSQPSPRRANITIGDARNMHHVSSESVDLCLTSPPYLNAIDYMRGHRLALVWLGYNLADLRAIRSTNIGTERGIEKTKPASQADKVAESMTRLEDLANRYQGMVHRYAADTRRLMAQIARVLKPCGRAVLVVGNSCLKGVFIRNSNAFVTAGRLEGLRLVGQRERRLPNMSRYLPTPASRVGSLGKRIRTETLLTFTRE